MTGVNRYAIGVAYTRLSARVGAWPPAHRHCSLACNYLAVPPYGNERFRATLTTIFGVCSYSNTALQYGVCEPCSLAFLMMYILIYIHRFGSSSHPFQAAWIWPPSRRSAALASVASPRLCATLFGRPNVLRTSSDIFGGELSKICPKTNPREQLRCHKSRAILPVHLSIALEVAFAQSRYLLHN
eukprot:4655721-Pleurochrysis_carterae.AAC.2